MMRQTGLVLPILAALVLAGCSTGGTVSDFGEELKALTEEVTARVDANPTRSGVIEARKLFAARKAQLRLKWEALIASKLGQEAKSELLTKVVDSQVSVRMLTTNHLQLMHQDRAFSDELSRLIADFESAFDPKDVS